jgi:hypothetical protein
VPVVVGVRIKGEPAATEHAGPVEVVEQTVFETPGPGLVNARLKLTPVKLIKPVLPTPGVALFRSFIVPVSPSAIEPPLKAIVVPAPALMHPLAGPGNQSIVVAFTITPWPPQLAKFKLPMTDADACGTEAKAEINKAAETAATFVNTGKQCLRIPFARSSFRLFIFSLREQFRQFD